ncbi:MAG: DUF1854 domain-containing protein [Armatimonadetes bacterium]|nr:DUF1854 domain-containing protein [Armatimonadota bacterium]MDW8122316.1 DUF1854 domain-containing protein [Armatimonadota bacterium]
MIPFGGEWLMSDANGQLPQLNWLDPASLRFFFYKGVLRLTVDEHVSYWQVRLFRSFALSEPMRYISVRDAANKEIGLIKDIRELDPESRQAAEQELHRRYLIPIVQKIFRVRHRFGMMQWDLETDRGRRNFWTRSAPEALSQPQPHQCLITDVDGNKYFIPDLSRLDPLSLAILRRYL